MPRIDLAAQGAYEKLRDLIVAGPEGWVTVQWPLSVVAPGIGEVRVEPRSLPVRHGWHIFVFWPCDGEGPKLGSGPQLPLAAVPLYRYECEAGWWAWLKAMARRLWRWMLRR